MSLSTSMTASEARARLPELLDRVVAGEEVTITRHRQPVAVVVRPDALRIRRAERALGAAGAMRDLLGGSRAAPLSARGTLAEERADELIEQVRAGRASR